MTVHDGPAADGEQARAAAADLELAAIGEGGLIGDIHYPQGGGGLAGRPDESQSHRQAGPGAADR